MSLLNTKGIKIFLKDGTVEHIDPVISNSEVEGRRVIYNGWYTYSYPLEDIKRTEEYDPSVEQYT